jgi:ribosomal protein S18 acetylase RimI-like enzyme
MPSTSIEIVIADLSNFTHATALVELLNTYAIDPMGGGEELSDYVKENLAKTLAARPDTQVIFALDGEEPIGMVVCIEGFSTFACKPLINIHDVIVKREYRGQGISGMMLEKVEQIAREKGCCKLTLEVLSGNKSARSAYANFGFEGFQLDPQMGEALFWQKKLD